tara:strand:+ start:982 stop:3885 length:2904 start_codon:yes stop_codon:yes gene_type:complete
MSKEELFIGGTRVDLIQDANVLVTKRLFDIESPSVRAYDFTKTIQAAGSKVNNKLFDFIFNTNSQIQNTTTTNFTPDFNPNLKASAEYFVDSVLIMDGTAQMIDMVVNDGKIVYNIYLFGKQIDLFEALGESKLTDLDLSAYDHTYNYTNIAASWSLTYTNGYVYPMVDYGVDNGNSVGPKVDYSDWNDYDFKPAIYDKVVLDKILSDNGYTYTSTFLDSTRFKNYIMPFCLEKLQMTSTDVEAERFKVSLTTLPTIIASVDLGTPNSSMPLVIFDDDTGGDLKNTSGTDFNTTTGKYVPLANYTQRFKLSVDFKIKYTDASGQGSITTNQNEPTAGNVYFNGIFSIMLDDGVNVTKIGSVISNDLTMVASGFVSGSVDGTIAVNTLSDEIALDYTSPEVNIKNGDKVYVVLELVTPSLSFYQFGSNYNWSYKNTTYIYTDYSIQIEDVSFEEVISNPSLNIGDTIPMSDTLPDYTQKDYIMDLVRQHNLIIEIDETNPTNLIIEPMVDYYNSEVNDLTPYLVNDKDFTIKPMGYLDGKKYILQYAKGEGALNKEYQDKYRRTYGDFELDVTNDFQTETKKVDLKLIPTPSVGVPSNNNRVIPYLRDERDKPRRLYWGGLKACSTFTISEFILLNTLTTYPYAGHLDDPYTPTLDLSFGTPRKLNWDNTYANTPIINMTNNNLHAGYWYNYLQEITSKDSKVIEAYFYLTPYRMRQLDFKQLHLVDNTYYRLIEIIDYDRTQPITKLKLLKTEFVTPITITTGLANGGSGGLGTWDRLPLLSARSPSSELVTQGADPTKIQGERMLVVGDDNLVAKGVTGGALINCNDRVLLGSEVWINDVNIERKIVVELSSAMILELATVPLTILPPCGVGKYIEVTKFTGFYTYGTTTYTAYNLELESDTTSTSLAALPLALYSGVVDTYRKATTIVDSEVVDINEGVILKTGTNPTTGDGTITLTIYYKIIEI